MSIEKFLDEFFELFWQKTSWRRSPVIVADAVWVWVLSVRIGWVVVTWWEARASVGNWKENVQFPNNFICLLLAYLSWKEQSLRWWGRTWKASSLALRVVLRGSMFLLKVKIWNFWNFQRFKLTIVKKGSKFPCFSVVDLVEKVQTNLVWLQFFVGKFGMGKSRPVGARGNMTWAIL